MTAKFALLAPLALVVALVGSRTANGAPALPIETAQNQALGKWLPRLFDGFDPWRQGRATRIIFHDRFVYEGNVLFDKYGGGPSDGRYFVYGPAGPVHAKAVYDDIHGIAFYGRGCCTFFTQVLATDVSAPPIPIPGSDLMKVHTERGIRLGDAPSKILKIFGRASLLRVAGHADLRVLAYTTAVPYETLQGTTNACGWFQNFAFRGNRLVYIDFTFGC